MKLPPFTGLWRTLPVILQHRLVSACQLPAQPGAKHPLRWAGDSANCMFPIHVWCTFCHPLGARRLTATLTRNLPHWALQVARISCELLMFCFDFVSPAKLSSVISREARAQPGQGSIALWPGSPAGSSRNNFSCSWWARAHTTVFIWFFFSCNCWMSGMVGKLWWPKSFWMERLAKPLQVHTPWNRFAVGSCSRGEKEILRMSFHMHDNWILESPTLLQMV